MLSESASGTQHYHEPWCRIARGRILLARGDIDGAISDSTTAIERARDSGDPQPLDPALVFGARVMLASGRLDEAEKLIKEFLDGLDGRLLNAHVGVDLGITMAALGISYGALEAVVLPSPWLDAVLAFVSGDP